MSKRDFNSWNKTAATCYFNKMKCGVCPNDEACAIGEKYFKDKPKMYNMRRMKETVLKIYANIGKKGIDKFI